MSKSNFKKIDVLREYRDKFGMDMPTKKLARIIYKENPLLYNTEETIRKQLMKIEGKGSSRVKITHKKPNRPTNPYNLPKSYQKERKPFILPVACNNILFIADIHAPYHDVNALTIVINYGKKHKINTVFINGDLLDFYLLSRFEKDPRKRSVKEEFDAAKEILRILRREFPKAQIYWLAGNHDQRYSKWLMTKVYEIFDDQYYQMPERLRLNEEKINFIEEDVLVKMGKLNVTHGHLLFKGVFTPVNPSRGAFLKAKKSIIVSHLHRSSHHPEIDIDGNVISCWSTGCLCELRPDYNPLVSNSQHGFAHITTEKNGDYHVRNYQIINGKIY